MAAAKLVKTTLMLMHWQKNVSQIYVSQLIILEWMAFAQPVIRTTTKTQQVKHANKTNVHSCNSLKPQVNVATARSTPTKTQLAKHVLLILAMKDKFLTQMEHAQNAMILLILTRLEKFA